TGPAHQRRLESAIYRGIVLTAAIALLAVRIPSIVSLQSAFVSGKASDAYSPNLTRLAEIAASRSKDSAFIAADWGTATQVVCIANGQEDLIYEPFWALDPAKRAVEIAGTTKKDNLYTLVTGIAPQFQRASASILTSLTSLPGWHEVPVEDEFM